MMGSTKITRQALISSGLEKQQHSQYDVKNRVLTLEGSAKSPKAKEQAEELVQTLRR